MATANTIREQLSQKKTEVDELKAKAEAELRDSVERLLHVTNEAEDLKKEIRNLRVTISEIENVSPYLMIVDFLLAGLTGMDQLVDATGFKANTIFQFLQALEKKGQVKRELEPGRKRGGKYTLTPIKLSRKEKKEIAQKAKGQYLKKKLAREAEASSGQQPTA